MTVSPPTAAQANSNGTGSGSIGQAAPVWTPALRAGASVTATGERKQAIAETEVSVLAVLLSNPKRIIPTMTILPDGEQFSDRVRGLIYNKIVDLTREHVVPTVLTVANRLPQVQVDTIQAIADRYDLALDEGEGDAYFDLARDVARAASLRRAKKALREAETIIAASPEDVQGATALIAQMVLDSVQVVEERDQSGAAVLDRLDAQITDIRKQLKERGTDLLGYSTGIPWFDEITAGLQSHHLWTLAGAYKGRKTSTALNLAIGACRSGASVAWYALEGEERSQVAWMLSMMANEWLLAHNLLDQAHLSEMYIKRKLPTEWQQKALDAARKEFRTFRFRIVDGRYPIRELDSLCNIIKRDRVLFQTDVFFVDHAAAITLKGSQVASDYVVSTAAAPRIQALLHEDEMCGVILAQQSQDAVNKGKQGEKVYGAGIKGGTAWPQSSDFSFSPSYDDAEPEKLKITLALSRWSAQGIEQDFEINRSSGLIVRPLAI